MALRCIMMCGYIDMSQCNKFRLTLKHKRLTRLTIYRHMVLFHYIGLNKWQRLSFSQYEIFQTCPYMNETAYWNLVAVSYSKVLLNLDWIHRMISINSMHLMHLPKHPVTHHMSQLVCSSLNLYYADLLVQPDASYDWSLCYRISYD